MTKCLAHSYIVFRSRKVPIASFFSQGSWIPATAVYLLPQGTWTPATLVQIPTLEEWVAPKGVRATALSGVYKIITLRFVLNYEKE